MKCYKTMMKYYQKHVDFNGLTHLLLGIGVGMLLTYPVAGAHPVRVGLAFIIAGLCGHAWAGTHKP